MITHFLTNKKKYEAPKNRKRERENKKIKLYLRILFFEKFSLLKFISGPVSWVLKINKNIVEKSIFLKKSFAWKKKIIWEDVEIFGKLYK